MLTTDTAALPATPTASTAGARHATSARLPTRTIVLIVLALLAPLALYFGTAASIVAIWNSSETFAHGYIIAPISIWLVWRRRENFLLYPPQPYWPALALLALAGAGWLAARIGGVQFIMQYAFVALFPLVALAVMGRRLAGSLAFPLLFLLFAVPFGDIFIAPLIDFTADFTVWALQTTGIPVLRNGTRFEIPTGSWSVVTACSGVRYLISSVTIGCLYAYLTYRTLPRRLAFIALSVVMPVLANGARAYMIVMIGHMSNMALATGVDHLVYGWMFFGLVMFLMFWVGSYWRDDHLAVPLKASPALADALPARLGPIVLAAVAVCALWPALALINDKLNHNPAPVAIASVPVSWNAVPPVSDWKPFYLPADGSFQAAYQGGGASRPVQLNLLYYRNQTNTKTLISSSNTMAEEGAVYHEHGSATRSETLLGQPLTLREVQMQGPRGNFLVWQWNWIDGQYGSGNLKGKLIQARAKLFLHGDDGAAVLLSAAYGEQPDEARAAMRAFLASQGGAIDAALKQAHGGAR